MQPNVPKQTGTSESCGRHSSLSRPKWGCKSLAGDEVIVVDDAIQVGVWVYPTSAGHATVRSSGHPLSFTPLSVSFHISAPWITRLQLDKGAGCTLSWLAWPSWLHGNSTCIPDTALKGWAMPNHLHTVYHLQDPESCTRYNYSAHVTRDDPLLLEVYLLIITCYQKLLLYRIATTHPCTKHPVPSNHVFRCHVIDRIIMLPQVSVNAKLFVIMDMNRLDVEQIA